MAAKKKVATPPVDVPDGLSDLEHHPLIARTKAALAKKWSLGRGESLEGATQVAWFLVAVRREADARALVEHVASGVTFTENGALWSAAADAIALAARLARLAGDAPRAESLGLVLAEHPVILLDALQKALAEPSKDVRSAEVEPSQKHACQFFARGCARAAYFEEAARAGAYDVDRAALEQTISEGLAGLRVYLAR